MINMWKVRELTEKVTNMVMNYTEVEAKVREATNDEAWGPTGPQMQELAQSTFYYEQFPEVMGMLWKRMLQENRAAWRRTYKSLLLLNYLVRNGSERVVTSAREHIYDLRTLENFKYIDEHGKDQGLNIRVKAKDLIDFIQDDNRLREERKKAKKNKDKYVGVSSDSMGFRGSNQSDWDNWGSSRRKQDESELGSSRFEDSPNASGDEVEDTADPVNEYRDEEMSPKSGRTSVTATPITSITKASTAPPAKKSSKPSKMVDLGAAATFGKDASQSQSQAPATQSQSNDLLDDLFGNATSNGTSSPAKTSPSGAEDDFDPRAGEAGSLNNKADFGDFSVAFTNNAAEASGNDDFADFSSFPHESARTVATGGSSNASLLMGMTPTPAACASSSTTPAVSGAASVPSSNNMDLLQGILGPATSSTHSTPSAAMIPSTGATNTDMGAFVGGLAGLTLSPTAAAPMTPAMPKKINEKRITKTEEEVISGEDEVKIQDVKPILGRQKTILRCLEEELAKSDPNPSLIVASLETVINFLPGELTPQQYAGLDQPSQQAQVFYKYICATNVAMVVQNFLNNGVLKKNYECKKLFYNFLETCYLEESVGALLIILNEKNLEKATVVGDLLERVILSDAYLFCLLRQCSLFVKKERQLAVWEETVRLLTSLPEKVANKLQNKIPKTFIPRIYGKVVAYHILQAIYFIADGLIHHIPSNIEAIGKLLGQLCYVSDAQAVLTPFVHWVKRWSSKNHVVVRITHRLFQHISPMAKERVIATLLKMEVDHNTLYVLLGDSGIICPKTRYLLTEKFLITRQISNYVSVPTIIGYLAASESSHKVLRATFQKLLDTWCDKSIMAHGSFEYHTNITRGLMVCLAHFTATDIDHCRDKVIEKMLHGVGHHLDSPNHQMKLVGMVTAEELTRVLCSDAPQLKFEYEDDKLTLDLKSLVCHKKKDNVCETSDDVAKVDDGMIDSICENKWWLEDFKLELQDLGMIPKSSNTISQEKDEALKTENIEKKKQCLVNTDFCSEQMGSNSSEVLDSDDDEFQPYDMSHDTPKTKVRLPSYPQEVLDYLIEGEAEKVAAALEVSEKIVRRESKRMDSELSVELAKVVLSLEDNYSTQDFEENRLRTLIALTVSHPSKCALYLGGEFYERNYNMKKRIDIIHSLHRAAIELSGDDSSTSSFLHGNLVTTSKDKHNVLKVNEMKNVAGCFFFPLVHGLTEPRPYLDLMDTDRSLLCELLRTLGVIVKVTGQCEMTLKMAACLLELTWLLRTHSDSEVRASCLEALGAGLGCVPNSVLLSCVPGELLDLQQWLAITLKEDKDKKCQLLAAQLALKLNKCFS
ncbi:LOW QUALITY PROTEIN: telomere length regulation protein TEL2 homolog [Procambarus clarkii]|uniref:LOW QUALITY PROTEIN: telomere length regulation protein TEL2 homolog n=1 Tax=Procambarus clarkii TaxID=6728 RepID=UPI0037435746